MIASLGQYEQCLHKVREGDGDRMAGHLEQLLREKESQIQRSILDPEPSPGGGRRGCRPL